MRRAWSVGKAAVRAVLRRTAGRRGPRWAALLLIPGLVCWLLLTGGAVGVGGAALGMLAGGWGLGLVPVHSNRLLTGVRRRPPPGAVPLDAPLDPPEPAAAVTPMADGSAGT
ncbi:hypothetical protein AB0K43_27765 [Kitasatospora sp. NPDC049258]|uniref:hypothetical protein n=1 Tax=Kitasatospora sp. NPDC049258 TaxID=3155394 RepID=UPI0034238983